MKKIFLIIVTMLVTINSFSQIKVGLKAGYNMATISDLDLSVKNLSLKLFEKDGVYQGFNGGIFANFNFGIIGFQPELLFSTQGGKQKFDIMGIVGVIPDDYLDYLFDIEEIRGFKINLYYKTSYITLPLLIEIKPFTFTNLGILIGPQFGMNLSKELSISISNPELIKYLEIKATFTNSDIDDFVDELLKENPNSKNPFKKMDSGLVMGLQYPFLDKMTICARYYLGLTDSFNLYLKNDDITARLKGWKNSVFQISMGISF